MAMFRCGGGSSKELTPTLLYSKGGRNWSGSYTFTESYSYAIAFAGHGDDESAKDRISLTVSGAECIKLVNSGVNGNWGTRCYLIISPNDSTVVTVNNSYGYGNGLVIVGF